MHIDYLKRVEKMLALPVERLVGNSSCNSLSTTTANSNSSRRMSISPDSSNSQGSISSTVSETGESGGGGKCHCPKISSSPPPAESAGPRHVNNNNNNNNDEDDQVRIKVESPEDDLLKSRPCHNNRFPINNRKSGEDKDVNHSHNHSRSAFMPIRPSAQNSNNNGHHNKSHKRSKDHHHEDTDDDDDNDNSDDEGDIDVDGDDDNKSNNKIGPGATTTTTTTNTATMCGGSSFSPSTNSSPCFNFRPFSVSNFGLNLSGNAKRDNGKSETAASLKFSIEDILRPDFGLTKFQLLAQHHHQQQQQQQIKRARIGPLLPSPSSSGGGGSSVSGRVAKGGSSSVSSTEGHRPYKPGPGSVIYHSEDSNGSCSSRREPEVVDDTKVNPPVPEGPLLWPAWVYCTRYSDRPSSGPRSRRIRKSPREIPEEKRPRTAFTGEQLSKLKKEFDENRYLTEKRRQDLARDLKLHENQIKIWFQNKRAKLKKSTGTKNGLAMQLMAQGLYNHSTVPVDEDDEMMMEMM